MLGISQRTALVTAVAAVVLAATASTMTDERGTIGLL